MWWSIGGGFTGMWTAWHLLEARPRRARGAARGRRLRPRPQRAQRRVLRVALAERGRALRARFGDAPGARAAGRLERGRGRDRRRGAATNDVDAWFDQSGYMCVSTAPGFDAVGARGRGGRRGAGSARSAWSALDAAAVQRPLRLPGVPRRRDGARLRHAPPRAPRRWGCAARLIERGALVYENSPRPSRCRRGATARACAVATGVRLRAGRRRGARGRPRPRAACAPLRSRLSVTSSHIVLTEPVPDVLEELGWTGGECITDGRTLVHYFRTTRDGRIVFGWGGGRPAFGARVNGRAEVDEDVAAEAHRSLLRIFPALEGRRITHAWGGPGGRVSEPHPPDRHACPERRCTTRSATRATAWGRRTSPGRTLAALAAGGDDPVTRLPIVNSDAGAWVPPEPLAWLGGLAGALGARPLRADGGAGAPRRPAHARGLRGPAGAGDAPGEVADGRPAARDSASVPDGARASTAALITWPEPTPWRCRARGPR